jgi:hypothetical protein
MTINTSTSIVRRKSKKPTSAELLSAAGRPVVDVCSASVVDVVLVVRVVLVVVVVEVVVVIEVVVVVVVDGVKVDVEDVEDVEGIEVTFVETETTKQTVEFNGDSWRSESLTNDLNNKVHVASTAINILQAINFDKCKTILSLSSAHRTTMGEKAMAALPLVHQSAPSCPRSRRLIRTHKHCEHVAAKIETGTRWPSQWWPGKQASRCRSCVLQPAVQQHTSLRLA